MNLKLLNFILIVLISVSSANAQSENLSKKGADLKLCPDDKHPHIIDMGAAGKWACCNVGASAPWEYGGYYAWGETEEKDKYDWDTYNYCNDNYTNCQNIGVYITGTKYDVAHVKWNGKWYMPNIEQYKLLLDNSTYKWITVQGVRGILYTASNGNSIFLPAAGFRKEEETALVKEFCTYWLSTQKLNDKSLRRAYFFSNDGWSEFNRCYGCNVRPIFISNNKSKSDRGSYLVCPDNKHPHVIDLGFVGKWACCNMGASAPWEYGSYYAWGDTEEKDNYDSKTYKHKRYPDVGNDIAFTIYDVAHVKWGGNWRMPNKEQIELLINNCASEWTTFSSTYGVYGRKFTAPNGGSIFLPAAGMDDDSEFIGKMGNYWSSLKHGGKSYCINFRNEVAVWLDEDCFRGLTVRPVSEDTIRFCPDNKHPHAIDLGIGVKWACCNVGASAPCQIGKHYAWGETEEKSKYTIDNYKYSEKSSGLCKNIGTDITATQFDVANVKWRHGWKIPNAEQFKKLIDCCKSKQTRINGVDGVQFTGPNGASIFIPGAGYRWHEGPAPPPPTPPISGYYWSSSINPEDNNDATMFCLKYFSDMTYYPRPMGLSVRPIKE